MTQLLLFLIQVAAIIAFATAFGAVFRLLHQPRVVGQMFAGIFLGPTLLGRLAPRLSEFILPSSSLDHLNDLSIIGLVIFMFLVGVQADLRELKGHGRDALLISHASITIPFVLASVLSLFLYSRLSNDTVPFAAFSLFMGTAISITAFPVLASILSEKGLLKSSQGTLALACAAVDDVTGWCILAAVVFLFRAAHQRSAFLLRLAGAVVFIVVMALVIRPALRLYEKEFHKQGRLSEGLQASMLVLLLLSAACTETIGIHALFGAFLFGTLMPKDPALISYLRQHFEKFTTLLLLPFFFTITGLRTNIDLEDWREMWFYVILIVVVATVGKIGGAALAARLGCMEARQAVGIGVLMNTRGLMELVVLNIGLDIGVISPTLFSMMIVMALTTTVMTGPLLDRLYRLKDSPEPSRIPLRASQAS